jgi:hypothetical protein
MKQASDLSALSKAEFNELNTWVSKSDSQVPQPVNGYLKRMMAVYWGCVQGKTRARQTLEQLRQSMGILPRSERGCQDLAIQGGAAALTDVAPTQEAPEILPEILMDEATRAQYELMRKKQADSRHQAREYGRELKKIEKNFKRSTSEQLEFDLAKPNEMLFSFPLAERAEEEPDRKVDRMKEFDKTRGLHVTKDHPKRMDLKVIATEITYHVETVTDPETGKSVRASLVDDGPEGFQLTWGAIGNLIKMHVGFAIPIHRMVLMIGQPEFSSSKICRALRHVALNLVGIYLYLSEELADVGLLSGDDTPTKVLDTSSPGKPDPICDEIDAWLGFIQPRADGQGDKKKLNVSLLIGKTEADPRSTIRFFRTHMGSVGNLLSKILESRTPKAGAVIFQGDLSSSNLPTPEIRKKTNLKLAGCGAHARRPFWRYRTEDEGLCYFMLRGFLKLSRIERRIDAMGRTRENILRLRGRYGRKIWQALYNRCIAATSGQIPGPATYPRGVTPNIWPPDSELHVAARYVIKHFAELTLYLDHPELEYTNNAIERALRIEKLMILSSKFRKTKRGRVVLDILRTINATCTAAHVDLTGYLCFVFKNLSETHDHPERFTPFAYAKFLDQEKQRANDTVTTLPSN